MSAPFQVELNSFYTNYVSNPTKQVNLGWTVTSIFFIMAFFIGLVLIGLSYIIMSFNSDYANGTKSKQAVVLLGYVGFGLVLLGLWTTINSFYTVVKKINNNIRADPDCSLFVPDNAVTAAELLISEGTLEQDITDIVNLKRSKQLHLRSQFSPSGQLLDNNTSLADLLPQNTGIAQLVSRTSQASASQAQALAIQAQAQAQAQTRALTRPNDQLGAQQVAAATGSTVVQTIQGPQGPIAIYQKPDGKQWAYKDGQVIEV